jgi:hypothetical protein
MNNPAYKQERMKKPREGQRKDVTVEDPLRHIHSLLFANTQHNTKQKQATNNREGNDVLWYYFAGIGRGKAGGYGLLWNDEKY